MVHYAVIVDGKVVGARSSKSHAQQVYTHALVLRKETADGYGIVSYHGGLALAMAARTSWSRQWDLGRLSIVPVSVTPKRAVIGASILEVGE